MSNNIIDIDYHIREAALHLQRMMVAHCIPME